MTSVILPLSALTGELSGTRYGVCAHDAGAANQILHWVIAGDLQPAFYSFTGPALALARASLPPFSNLEISELISECDALISGTGWGEFEYQAMLQASSAALAVFAVFDHWVNYGVRLKRGGKTLPVKGILVADRYAADRVCADFSDVPCYQLPGRYLESQAKEIGECSDSSSALFLMEPVREKWPGTELAGEFLAFDYFMEHLRSIAPDITRVVVRPHPSDAQGKYAHLQSTSDEEECQVHIQNTDAASLADAIGGCALVVGLQSYAMAVALTAGKRVLSALPPEAPAAVLPFEEIEYIRGYAQ